MTGLGKDIDAIVKKPTNDPNLSSRQKQLRWEIKQSAKITNFFTSNQEFQQLVGLESQTQEITGKQSHQKFKIHYKYTLWNFIEIIKNRLLFYLKKNFMNLNNLKIFY